jgi:general secretion pathway protein G
MERLTRARQLEQRARRFVWAACSAALITVGAIFAGAAYEVTHAAWPDWMRMLLAMLFILSPLTALLLTCLYLFRYQLELGRAKRAARDQALNEIPRQISQLRQELEELRRQSGRSNQALKSGGEKAFTLIELLTVLGVIGLLASLLLPGLAHAKARARITACKNNLRQLSKGLAMYEADYRFFPGAGNDVISLKQAPWLIPSPECWVAKVTPYLTTNTPAFLCPDYQPVTNSQSYGYNAGGSCPVNYPPYHLGLGLGEGFGFVSFNGVMAPAEMIALGDLQLPSSVFRFVISPWHKQPLGGLASIIPQRHAGGCDMAFLDGHVEWAKQNRWVAETEIARSRWNNDHQPHCETW